ICHRAGEDRVGNDVVLIAIGAECVNLFLMRRLKDAKSRRVSIVEQQVRALADLRERRFLGRADIIEAAGEARQHAAIGQRLKKSLLESIEGQKNRGKLDSSD